MSIPVDAEHAVGGELAAGDRIDLILVGDGGPRYILADGEVFAVVEWRARGAGLRATPSSWRLIRPGLVLPEEIRDGRIEIVRSTAPTPRAFRMNEIEVALAVSARVWPDRLHRFSCRSRWSTSAPRSLLRKHYCRELRGFDH